MTLAVALAAAMLASAGPASARAGHASCEAFGRNVASLARNLGATFGQTAAGNAPLAATVEAEQAALCEGR